MNPLVLTALGPAGVRSQSQASSRAGCLSRPLSTLDPGGCWPASSPPLWGRCAPCRSGCGRCASAQSLATLSTWAPALPPPPGPSGRTSVSVHLSQAGPRRPCAACQAGGAMLTTPCFGAQGYVRSFKTFCHSSENQDLMFIGGLDSATIIYLMSDQFFFFVFKND